MLYPGAGGTATILKTSTQFSTLLGGGIKEAVEAQQSHGCIACDGEDLDTI